MVDLRALKSVNGYARRMDRVCRKHACERDIFVVEASLTSPMPENDWTEEKP